MPLLVPFARGSAAVPRMQALSFDVNDTVNNMREAIHTCRTQCRPRQSMVASRRPACFRLTRHARHIASHRVLRTPPTRSISLAVSPSTVLPPFSYPLIGTLPRKPRGGQMQVPVSQARAQCPRGPATLLTAISLDASRCFIACESTSVLTLYFLTLFTSFFPLQSGKRHSPTTHTRPLLLLPNEQSGSDLLP